MKRKLICGILAAVMLLVLATPAYAAEIPFIDVEESDWFYGSVEYVYSRNLMYGTTQNRFGPYENMTRAMLVAVLYRYEGSPETDAETPFMDLEEGEYYENAVSWAYENGIVAGTAEDTFSPHQNVTREQIVAIFYRYADYLGRDTFDFADLSGYADEGWISDYAVDAFAWAVAAGIIVGEGANLNPKDGALRSQCAAILSRFDGRVPPEPVYTDLYVLMYHSVAPDGTDCGNWTITESKFREHLQWMEDHGYTPVLPSELISGEPLPKNAVLISFDDGYADNYELAFPILQEFGYKAVIAVIVSEVDSGENRLSWDMCREMVDSGLIEIGSHTYNLHPYPGLRRLEGETYEEYTLRVFPDIEESYLLIEDELGVEPLTFAYPNGVVDEWAIDCVNGYFPVTMYVDFEVKNDISNGTQGLTRYNINDDTDLSKILMD